MTPSPVQGVGAAVPRDERAALRSLSHQLEGVFLAQLFQAMRSSVPESGLTENAPGRDMFTALLDERIANEASTRLQRGLGEALYRQVSRRLASPPGEGTP